MELCSRLTSGSSASCSGRLLAVPCRSQQRPRTVAARAMSGFPGGIPGVGRGPVMPMGPPGGGAGGGGAPGEDVAHDPDGLYKGVPLRSGIIERRMMTKRIEEDKEFAKAMANATDEMRKQALLRRETRRPPANHQELVEYFLNTMAEDLEYEVARYRPRLTPDFFTYLDTALGAERFSDKPDEDRLAELDLLRKYLVEASEAVDKCVTATSSAVDRMKKLLTAKDKKQMILDMAAANEIDQALMDLLTQNIDMARSAGQEEPAKFMEKVKQACAKYLVSTPAAAQAALPQVPAQLAGKAAGAATLTAGGIALPASASSGAPLGRTIITASSAAAEAQQQKQKQQQQQQQQAAPGGGVILTPGQAPPANKQPGSLIL